MNIYKYTAQHFFLPDIIATHLKEEVDKVWVLLQFGTDYTKKLNLFIFCRSSQNFPTQTNKFLTEEKISCTTHQLAEEFLEKDQNEKLALALASRLQYFPPVQVCGH